MSERPPIEPPVTSGSGTDPSLVAPTPLQRFTSALALSPKAFQGRIRPVDWIVALLIVVVVQFASSVMIQDLVLESTREQISEQFDSSAELTEEQREEALGRVETGVRVSSYVMPFLAVVAACLVTSALLMLIMNFGFGGTVRFAPLWAVACLSWAPKAIHAILFTLLAKLGNTVQIAFGPAALVPSDSGLLRSVLGVFDIFDFWMIGIQIVGVGVVTALPRGKSRAAVIILWVAWWVIRIAMAVAGNFVQGRVSA
jgi:hypothetical protein